MTPSSKESPVFASDRATGAATIEAVILRIYIHHTRKHLGLMLFDWILEEAKAIGIHGGSAFCATSGFGRHGVIHEQRFIELAADLPIMVEFIVSDEEADRLIDMLGKEKVHTFCTRTRTEIVPLGDF